MKTQILTIAVGILTLGGICAEPEKDPDFAPPASYRSIHFAEHGGGPIAEYSATGFDRIETPLSTAEHRLVFTTALPPSTATKTVVAGGFLLVRHDGGWRVADQLRFEASGKDSGASLKITASGNGPPHFTVTLNQGGRGYSYSQSASYTIKEGKLALDLPTPIQAKPAAAFAGGEARPRFHRVADFLIWADKKLTDDNYQALITAQADTKDTPPTKLEYVKKLDSDLGEAKLAKVFEGREFPKDAATFKLGGHQKELGHCHIDFVKEVDSWQITKIWQCR